MPTHRFSSALLLLLLASASETSRTRDSIVPGEPLTSNDTLVSAGGGFELGFFTPPGSNKTYVGVWYARVSPRTVVWVTNRADPVPGHANATLSVSRDNCSLAIADANSTVVWSVSPPASAAAATVLNPCTARIRDDGNLVVTDAWGRVTWQGFDHPTDTLLPGMRIGVDFTGGGKNMTLTAWKSPSDPSPSQVVVAMEISGDPEIFLWNGPNKVWRSGPWDGVQFTGVPDTLTYSDFTFNFVNDHREVTYSFNIRHNASVVSRLTVNTTGTLQRWAWSSSASAWSLYWYAPKDQCDAVSPCGANGVCDVNALPPCSCLRGFAPRSPEAWAMRDGRDGCARETPLDCGNGTDGFAVVRHAKAPDTTRAAVDYGAVGLRQCRQRCLGDCSCTAYASANLSAPAGRRGCVMWTGGLEDLRVYPAFGQDLYVRLAAADLGGCNLYIDYNRIESH
uniref:non-specific serine/threonine protein kinase n=1 Tax=Leersia perrieri TaxID=77586 RepID=A0A0D9WIB2_9ORYZ